MVIDKINEIWLEEKILFFLLNLFYLFTFNLFQHFAHGVLGNSTGAKTIENKRNWTENWRHSVTQRFSFSLRKGIPKSAHLFQGRIKRTYPYMSRPFKTLFIISNIGPPFWRKVKQGRISKFCDFLQQQSFSILYLETTKEMRNLSKWTTIFI